MKNIFLTLAIVSTALFATAQDSSAVKTNNIKHKLGLHAGTTTGVGLSYKLELQNKHQFQVVALPIASKHEKVIFTGLSYRYKFKTMDNWDALAYVGGSYYYDSYSSADDFVIEPSSDVINQSINVSGGLAFEYGKSEFFKVNLQLGYGLYDIFTQDWRTNLSGGIGFDFLLNNL